MTEAEKYLRRESARILHRGVERLASEDTAQTVSEFAKQVAVFLDEIERERRHEESP